MHMITIPRRDARISGNPRRATRRSESEKSKETRNDMREFFKSKFFIAALIVALTLVIVPTVFSVMGLSMYIRNAVNTALMPVQGLLTKATDALEGYTMYITDYERLKDENERLKDELAASRDRIHNAEEYEELMKFYSEHLQIKREHMDFMFEPADITGVGKTSGNYMTVVNLNKGSDHGITVDMPIISGDAVIGYTVEVGGKWSKAVTLIESASSVGAYISRTGQMGVVEGNFTLISDGLCEMKYIPADADVQVGDRVVSSGLGSVYPKGLVIGYVEAVDVDSYGRSLVVKVKPAADLTALARVMIIVDYDVYTE
jgi:rod shape-determining protein MreC